MQYSTLIYMKFKDREAWKRILGKIKFGEGNSEVSLLSFCGFEGFLASLKLFKNGVQVSESKRDCLINCGFLPQSVEDFIRGVVAFAGRDILILGDCCNVSTDPYAREVYYLGGEVHTYDRSSGVDKHREIQISNIKAWLGKKRITELTDEEKAYLEEFTG
jgi:hypothetical protein